MPDIKAAIIGSTEVTAPNVSTDVIPTVNAAGTTFGHMKIETLFKAIDALVYKGAIDASANPNYPAADAGHVYKISVAGKIGGGSGTNVEAGDTIVCNVDSSAGGTQAAVGANWSIIQANTQFSSFILTLLDDADAATARATLGAQAQDSFLDQIAALSDPGGPRLLYWDDATNELKWLEIGAGLAITGGVLDVAAPSSPPTFVAAGAIASGASVQPTPPTHQADDILIQVVYEDSGTNPSITTATSGWAKIGQDDNAGWTSTAYFWKRATGAGTSGAVSSHTGDAIVFVIRGCIATGDPFEDATTAGLNSSTAPASSAIDTLGDNRLAVAIFTFFTGANFSGGYPPSGWTNDSNTSIGGGGGGDARFAFMSKTVASAGAVAAETMTSGSTSWHSLTLAFIPE